MRTTWNFRTPGQLLFGRGAVRELGTQLRRRQWQRVLLITDKTLLAVGMVTPIEQACRAAGCIVERFAGGVPEPTLATAEEARQAAREFAPTVIVGLGGGSNMDLAKMTSLLHAHGGQPADYFGFDRVPGPVTPLVCIPTTAGTGSEVSHSTVLTDTANQMKVSTLSYYLRPQLALVDPELTYSCPRQVTADSGIDVLVHAIEAYTAVDFSQLQASDGEANAYEGRHPLGDLLAEKAITLVGQYLVRAVEEPHDHEAREQMALAATLAGMAFSNCGVALVHALEYPLGGALHCSHGAGNGLLLPFVMRFNLPQRTAAFARIATLLGEPSDGDPALAAEQAIAAVERLRERIGIPLRIRDLGGKREQLADFAAKSFAIRRLMELNPRRATQAELLAILEQAF